MRAQEGKREATERTGFQALEVVARRADDAVEDLRRQVEEGAVEWTKELNRVDGRKKERTGAAV